jgi:predicted MFS family arabinose efflux permease
MKVKNDLIKYIAKPTLKPLIIQRYKTTRRFAYMTGFSESLIGWIIGILALSSTCISSFTPLLIKKFTRIKLLYVCTFFEATSTLLYGVINFINSFYMILIFMFIIKIIHGFCTGIIGTLVYSLTISLSKPTELKKILR